MPEPIPNSAGASRDPAELLTRRDLEALLRVSRSVVYRRVADGSLPPPIYLGTTTPRWRRADVEAFVANAPTSPPPGRPLPPLKRRKMAAADLRAAKASATPA